MAIFTISYLLLVLRASNQIFTSLTGVWAPEYRGFVTHITVAITQLHNATTHGSSEVICSTAHQEDQLAGHPKTSHNTIVNQEHTH